MLDDRPHRLGISVRGDVLRLLVDEGTICSTRASQFVTPGERKYVQVRTETSVVGSNGGASVTDVHLKRDSDPNTRCRI